MCQRYSFQSLPLQFPVSNLEKSKIHVDFPMWFNANKLQVPTTACVRGNYWYDVHIQVRLKRAVPCQRKWFTVWKYYFFQEPYLGEISALPTVFFKNNWDRPILKCMLVIFHVNNTWTNTALLPERCKRDECDQSTQAWFCSTWFMACMLWVSFPASFYYVLTSLWTCFQQYGVTLSYPSPRMFSRSFDYNCNSVNVSLFQYWMLHHANLVVM